LLTATIGRVASSKEIVALRHRFAVSMTDCRAAAGAHPGDVPAQFGSLYRRVVGQLREDAAEPVLEPWLSEFRALNPSERSRMLHVARQPTD
jgi:hypothetical protein